MAEHQHDKDRNKDRTLGDVPGNQTPGTPGKKESEHERGGSHQSERGKHEREK